jgi:hypothetical protein
MKINREIAERPGLAPWPCVGERQPGELGADVDPARRDADLKHHARPRGRGGIMRA